MNINQILNSVISGLICTAVTALSIYLYKAAKKAHNKNKELFWHNVYFYLALFGAIYCAIFFEIDQCTISPFSLGNTSNVINLFCLIINIFAIIFHYNDFKNY